MKYRPSHFYLCTLVTKAFFHVDITFLNVLLCCGQAEGPSGGETPCLLRLKVVCVWAHPLLPAPPIMLVQRAMCWAVMWCVNMFSLGLPTVPGYLWVCMCIGGGIVDWMRAGERERDEFGERTVREGVTWGLYGLDPRQRGPVYGARVHPSSWCPI